MQAFQSRFYHKGVDEQKRADIIVSFSRPDTKKINKWSDEEKEAVKSFMIEVEAKFKLFKAVINNS